MQEDLVPKKSSSMQLRVIGSLVALTLGTLAACTNSTGPKSRYPLKLSISTRARAASGALASLSRASSFSLGGGPSRALTFGPAGEIVITKAQIVLDHIELSPSEGLTCNGDGPKECEELDQDAMIVDLPVTPGLITALTVPVTSGTFVALQAELQSPKRGIPGRPEFDGKSVRIEGTYKGIPFLYTSNAKASIEMSFNPPVVVTAASRNITVNIDISRWFLTADGAAIDPATATLDGPNERLVKKNIKASFSAFSDDRETGTEDGK